MPPRAATLQALRDQRPVEPHQRHDVADRAERDQIQPAAQVRLRAAGEMTARAQRAVERHHREERDPDRGQLADRADLVAPVRIDHPERLRQLGLCDVMIDHDDLLALGGGARERLERRGASIQDHHEPAALGGEALQRLSIRSVALAQPIRDVDRARRADGGEIAGQERDRGGAVDVVVAEQADPLLRLHGIRQTLGREVEVEQMRRVGQDVAQARRDERRHAVERDAAPGQHAADHLRQIEALTDGERGRGIVPAPAPAATADGALDRRRPEVGRRCAQVANSGTTSRLRAM